MICRDGESILIWNAVALFWSFWPENQQYDSLKLYNYTKNIKWQSKSMQMDIYIPIGISCENKTSIHHPVVDKGKKTQKSNIAFIPVTTSSDLR